MTEPLVRIFGSSASIIDNDRMEEAWGDVFFQKKVIVFDEVYQPDMRQFNRLKPRLANDDLEHLNIKGGQLITQKNLYSMYLFSNHDDALRFDITENKLLVIRSPSSFINGTENGSADFYSSLGKKLDCDAYIANIYHYLLNVDISDFSNGRLPLVTQATKNMVNASRPEAELLMQEWIEDGDTPFNHKAFKLDDLKKQLDGAGYARFSRKNITKFLREHGFESYLGEKRVDGERLAARFWANDEACDRNPPSWLYEYYMKNSKGFFSGYTATQHCTQ